MNLETEQPGGDTAAPVDDLRSTIAAAVAGQRGTPADTTAEPAKAPEAKPAAELKPVGEEKPKREDGRDESGRFAAKAEPAKPAETGKAPEAAKPTEETAKAPDAAAAEAVRPPPGWSPAAKVAFEKADPAIREAVAKREIEVNQGLAKLAEFKGLDEFVELAKQNGTTVGQAFQNYRAVETLLGKDFVGGITAVCKQFGVDPQALASVIQKRGGGAGAGEAKPADRTAAQPIQIDPEALVARARAEAIKEFEQRQSSASTQAAIEQFRSDPKHRFYDNVRPQMAALLQSGASATLDDAYERACWADPQVRSILISEDAAAKKSPAPADVANQARAAAKATNGAPGSGLKPGSVAADPNRSLRDTIVAARDAQAGRV